MAQFALRAWKRYAIAILYLCRQLDGERAPDNQKTDAAEYLDRDGIEKLPESAEPLSAWLAQRILRGEYTLVTSDDSNPFHPRVSYA